MKNYFTKISDMSIGNRPIPQQIIDKIIKFHTEPMNVVRHELGVPIFASQNSGFRPYEWEIARGRSGNSQHTFGQKKSGLIRKNEKGAVDWTCKNFKSNKDVLLELIIKHTNYTRIAIYNGFLHCDHKPTNSGRKQIFKSTSSSKWTLIKEI